MCILCQRCFFDGEMRACAMSDLWPCCIGLNHVLFVLSSEACATYRAG